MFQSVSRWSQVAVVPEGPHRRILRTHPLEAQELSRAHMGEEALHYFAEVAVVGGQAVDPVDESSAVTEAHRRGQQPVAADALDCGDVFAVVIYASDVLYADILGQEAS